MERFPGKLQYRDNPQKYNLIEILQLSRIQLSALEFIHLGIVKVHLNEKIIMHPRVACCFRNNYSSLEKLYISENYFSIRIPTL